MLIKLILKVIKIVAYMRVRGAYARTLLSVWRRVWSRGPAYAFSVAQAKV